MLNNQDFALFRTKSLGGSDIGAILGLSKYRSAVDVWLEKTQHKISIEDNISLRFGSFAEEFVAGEYARLTGKNLVHDETTLTHLQYPFFTAHIDRFVVDPNSPLWIDGKLQAKSLLECKTANPFTHQEWGEPGSDQVPMSYLVQCLWYLMMTGCDHIDLAVLFGNADFRIYSIKRDQELETILIEKALDFWNNYVQTNIPPPASSEADCRHLFTKETNSKRIEASQHTLQTLKELEALQTDISEKEEKVSQIKQHIMQYMQDAEELVFEEKVIASWKTPKPSLKLDTKRLSTEHPEWLAPYQQLVSSSRRLLIKGVK